jgi:hypothetical protein
MNIAVVAVSYHIRSPAVPTGCLLLFGYLTKLCRLQRLFNDKWDEMIILYVEMERVMEEEVM